MNTHTRVRTRETDSERAREKSQCLLCARTSESVAPLSATSDHTVILQLVSLFAGALSSVNHKGLHQGCHSAGGGEEKEEKNKKDVPKNKNKTPTRCVLNDQHVKREKERKRKKGKERKGILQTLCAQPQEVVCEAHKLTNEGWNFSR